MTNKKNALVLGGTVPHISLIKKLKERGYHTILVDYLNNREDISYDDEVYILEKLGFTVDSDGNVYWD